MNSNGTVGVLAIQGSVIEHARALEKLGADVREVRLPEHLDGVAGLIIPGGESTTIGKLSVRFGLFEPIRERANQGMALWGTCAGLILMAKDLGESKQPTLGLLDARVTRNAFGAQLDSFETDLKISAFAGGPFHAVFIRAPVIESVGEGVQILARLKGGRIVAAREENLLCTAFHPELTDDMRFHQYFLDMVGATRLRTAMKSG